MSIRTNAARALLKERGVEDIPHNITLEQLINLIKSNCHDAESLLASPTRLELEYGIDACKASCDRKLDRATAVIPAVYGAIVVIVTLVAGMSTFFGIGNSKSIAENAAGLTAQKELTTQLSNLLASQAAALSNQKDSINKAAIDVAVLLVKLGEAEERLGFMVRDNVSTRQQLTEALAALQAERSFVELLRQRYPIDNLLPEIEQALGAVTLAFGDDRLFEQCARLFDSLTQIESAAPSARDSDPLIPYLRSIVSAVLAMQQVKQNPNVESIKKAIDSWELVQAPAGDDMRLGSFLNRVRSRKENILGLLDVTQFDLKKDNPTFLDAAQTHFEISQNLDPQFPNAVSNQASVLTFRVELLMSEPNADTAKVRSQLEVAARKYEEASTLTTDPDLKAVFFNNSASTRIQLARAELSASNAAGAIEQLQKAQSQLTRARDLGSKRAVLFITEAELLCVRVGAEDIPTAASDCQQRFDGILEKVSLAMSLGYSGYNSRSRENFLEREPSFEFLAKLNITGWRERLYEAARLK